MASRSTKDSKNTLLPFGGRRYKNQLGGIQETSIYHISLTRDATDRDTLNIEIHTDLSEDDFTNIPHFEEAIKDTIDILLDGNTDENDILNFGTNDTADTAITTGDDTIKWLEVTDEDAFDEAFAKSAFIEKDTAEHLATTDDSTAEVMDKN